MEKDFETVNGIKWAYTVSDGKAMIYDSRNNDNYWDDPHPAIPSSTSGAIIIPSSLGGYPVTKIGDNAFVGCTGLTSVEIPSSVTTIGDRAFSECSGLASVHISDIAAWCSIQFSDYTSNPLYYAKRLYLNGSLVTNLEIPSSVTTIGRYAFYGCSSLTSVTFPEGVTSIGDWAFYGCSSLTSVTIPSSVTTIGDAAFPSCSGLTSVTISEGVTKIGRNAFSYCGGLTSVTFEGVPPTTVGSYAFYGVASGCKGYYPSTKAEEWEAEIGDGKWCGLTMEEVSISEIPTFAVNVTVVGDGQVSGTGKYEAGAEVSLTAVPGEGMVFCGWSTTPVTASATYTFTMPAAKVALTAYFAPAVVVESYVSRNNLKTEEEVEAVVEAEIEDYVTANNLMSKEAAVQAALDADEVFTADEIQEMAFDTPVVEVKEDVIEIAISLQTAETLNAWQAMALQGATLEIDSEKGQVRVKVPKGDKKAAFYKFVVPNNQ